MKSEPTMKGVPHPCLRVFLRRQGGDFDFVLKRSNVVKQVSRSKPRSGVRIQPTAQAVGEKRKDAQAAERRKKFSLTTPPSDTAASPAPTDTHTPPARSRSRPAS